MMIERSIGMSSRYINKLFEAENTSLMRYVLNLRLERCAQDLANPQCAMLRVRHRVALGIQRHVAFQSRVSGAVCDVAAGVARAGRQTARVSVPGGVRGSQAPVGSAAGRRLARPPSVQRARRVRRPGLVPVGRGSGAGAGFRRDRSRTC